MPITLNDYRCKLINKILFAASQEEVGSFIDAAMKGLEENKVNGHIVYRIVNMLIYDLEQFNPMDKNAQQWSNIKLARTLFNKLKTSSQTTPSP